MLGAYSDTNKESQLAARVANSPLGTNGQLAVKVQLKRLGKPLRVCR
jgi:hypothetical protein